MTDREAIEWFERRKAMCLSDRCQQAEDAALSALKEREERSAQPPADVAPVVHGRWIENQHWEYKNGNMTMNGDTGVGCSACGKVNFTGINQKTPYCPSCGAKMDLEDEG